MSYAEFLDRKRRLWLGDGISTNELNPLLFDWQRAIVRWALKKGRAAIFADCGLGKSFMQIEWARALGQRTLFFAPLCVAEQTVSEAAKLGVPLLYVKRETDTAGAQFVITNYERIDEFDMDDYGAVVLDESSILKAFTSKTRAKLIEACARVRYRLCCTATPSPNDLKELGNHAEFLGLMTRSEYLATWFIHDDQGWRMKKHARQAFYRWMASWAMALRSPADIGYSDAGYVLPPLTIQDHIIPVDGPTGDTLFPELSTKGLKGRLTARRGSLESRIDTSVTVMDAEPDDQWIAWCGLNVEADGLAARLPHAVNVEGSDDYDTKSQAVTSFVNGDIRSLISKVSILGFGMNFQNCSRMLFCGIGDSYEQYYQAIRRCWRFGQMRAVHAHVIISEAEQVIVENVRRKEATAADLARELIAHMADFEQEELAS